MRWVLGAVVVVTACGDNLSPDEPYFSWSGQRAVGAFSIDTLHASDDPMHDRIEFAREDHSVVLFYGHLRPHRTSPETIDALLSAADAAGLETVTFADLAAGTRVDLRRGQLDRSPRAPSPVCAPVPRAPRRRVVRARRGQAELRSARG